MKKILGIGLFCLTVLLLSAPFTFAQSTYTVETIASDTGGVLNTTVDSVIEIAVDFITANLPIIVVVGVAFGMVFWLIRKIVNAIKGRV